MGAVPVLGIEGTAHTVGVGIVDDRARNDERGRCRVLANVRDMLLPEEGGIHPREAAHHHAETGPDLLRRALDDAGLEPGDLDAVAFSQGPGLGPCLRVAATMARALAVRHALPLVGVNHCVAHLEVGRGMTGARDPVLLYASGANTQVIAFARGRYRVFGETLDIGIGNALDKFARDNGVPFPGGPRIEKEAAARAGVDLRELPYTVKGMDLGFSGLVTASQRLVDDGLPFAEAAYSLQETAFAALVEVAERALAHTGRSELLLGGGVACNLRLQAMARAMVEARGGTFHCPPPAVLVDNGVMIAWLGLLKLRAGDTLPVAASAVRPYERTDHVEATWRRPPAVDPPAPGLAPGAPVRGAEAIVEPATMLGRAALAKRRVPKTYRHSALDDRLRRARTRDEAHLLVAARRAGVPVPVVLDVDRASATIRLEPVQGPLLRHVLPDDDDRTAAARLERLGRLVARLHDAGITHGDLTTSNLVVPDPADPASLVVLDFGLGQATAEDEPRGVDLHLVEEALAATDDRAEALFRAFLGAYRVARDAPDAAGAVARLEAIRERGRYR